MYLKTDVLTLKVDGVTFHSHDNIPAPKYLFDPTALIGWTDGVDVKRSAQARQQNDGDFPEPTNFSSRVIIASGSAIANSVQQIHEMRDKFTKILSDKKYQELSVTDGSGTRYSTVSLASKPSWIQETDKTAVWKIEFYAPDPYLYGPEQISVTSGNVLRGGLEFVLDYPLDFQIVGTNNAQVIHNRGNAKMWPKFIVQGDFYSGFTISDNANKKVTYNGLVTIEAPVTIDMARGVAIQSNVDKSYLLTDRDWFSVPPYGTIQPLFTPLQNGNGWCNIVYRNTWI